MESLNARGWFATRARPVMPGLPKKEFPIIPIDQRGDCFASVRKLITACYPYSPPHWLEGRLTDQTNDPTFYGCEPHNGGSRSPTGRTLERPCPQSNAQLQDPTLHRAYVLPNAAILNPQNHYLGSRSIGSKSDQEAKDRSSQQDDSPAELPRFHG